MRGAVRRSCTAGLITVALVAGLGACTGDSGGTTDGKGRKAGTADKAVVQACENGTFTWSNVTKRDRLTGVSERERLGDGGGPLKKRFERVYTPRPSVRADGPAPSAAEVLFSLGKKIGEIDSDARSLAEAGDGETWAFTDVRQPAPVLDDDRFSPHAAGEFVQYAGVREVTGDFRYTCPGGKTATGRAQNWTVAISGLIDCTEPMGTGLAREAAQRSCEEAVAARPSPSGV